MKVRAIKTRHIRKLLAVVPQPFKYCGKPVFFTNVKTLFPVYRKKDNALIDTVTSEAAAQALVLKAKTAKKASLYIGESYTA